jgi:hypothetical protein
MTTTPPTGPGDGGISYNTLSAELAGPVNRAELHLVSFLTTVPADAQLSVAQAVRRRGPRECRMYAHAADLAVRMPALFDRMVADTRYSVEHLEAVWSRISRHARALARAGREMPADVDTKVAEAVLDWISDPGHSVGVPAVSDVTDATLVDVAEIPVAETEAAEAKTVGLRKRDTRLILECGDPMVAAGLWETVSDAALDVRKELIAEQETLRAGLLRQDAIGEDREEDSAEMTAARQTVTEVLARHAGSDGDAVDADVADEEPTPTRAEPLPPPGMARCRGEAMLGILGGRRSQLKVTVNVYTPAGGPDDRPDNGGPGPEPTPEPDREPDRAPAGNDPAGPTAPAAPACRAGYIIGTGWVSPAATAVLAGAADLVRKLPALDEIRDTSCYRFTTRQRAAVIGRDVRCRFPGCQVPADRCELDHIVNSSFTDPTSDGPTDISNCACLCRTHHALKTRKIWQVCTPDNGVTLAWTGPEEVAVTTVASGPVSPSQAA